MQKPPWPPSSVSSLLCTSIFAGNAPTCWHTMEPLAPSTLLAVIADKSDNFSSEKIFAGINVRNAGRMIMSAQIHQTRRLAAYLGNAPGQLQAVFIDKRVLELGICDER